MHNRKYKNKPKPHIHAHTKSSDKKVQLRRTGMFVQKSRSSYSGRLSALQASISYKHIFFALLLLSPHLLRLLCANNMHSNGVKDITGVPCLQKTKGVSKGKTCNIDGQVHYLKEYSLFSAQNAVFIKNVIGIKTPATTLFTQQNSGNDPIMYIAAKEIMNLKLASGFKISQQDLGELGRARLAVAATFIDDLHPDNWGVDDEGVVLIDVDGKNNPPTCVSGYVEMARKALNSDHMPPLSLCNLEEMYLIYQDMRSKDLPKFEQKFYMAENLYVQVLDVYIKACQGAIDKIKQQKPELTNDVPCHAVNQVLVNRMHAQQQRALLSNKLR